MKNYIFNIRKLTILFILLTVSQALKAQCTFSFDGKYVTFGSAGGYKYVELEAPGSYCHPASFTNQPNWIAISYTGSGNTYYIYCNQNNGAARLIRSSMTAQNVL